MRKNGLTTFGLLAIVCTVLVLNILDASYLFLDIDYNIIQYIANTTDLNIKSYRTV